MREQIDGVALEGQRLRVTARRPLPVEPSTLALATAIRVFEHYPILDRLTLTISDEETEVTFTREEIERLLGPAGFAALKAWGGWRQVLARAVQAHAGEGAP